MRWAGHVARTGDRRYAYRVLVGISVVTGRLQSDMGFGPVVKPTGITVKKEGGKVVETSGCS